MNPEEAQLRIRALYQALKHEFAPGELGELDEAYKALEAKIPRKPEVKKSQYEDFDEYFCPWCRKRINTRFKGIWLTRKLQKHCFNCGQKLDWSDTNIEYESAVTPHIKIREVIANYFGVPESELFLSEPQELSPNTKRLLRLVEDYSEEALDNLIFNIRISHIH